MEKISDKLYSWSVDTDPGTILQAGKTSRLPIIHGHLALMPDAHVGMGATVGSVMATENAVIPSAVGVDIGCGMIAVLTDLTAADLPDDMEPVLPRISKAIPAGVGEGHQESTRSADRWFKAHPMPETAVTDAKLRKTALVQFGTLGSGNHFFEICLDDQGDRVWIVLHSGSRGVGNKLAQGHIKVAKQLAKEAGIPLEDKDLAWLQAKTPEFDAYIADMLWGQAYARGNRDAMMDAALKEVFDFIGSGREVERINCHHNFCQQETHGDSKVWVTRKGAIKASTGDLGVIPGSMGTRSYIVRGLGNPLSWESCSHGAGRRMSRTVAKATFTEEDLNAAMAGKVWNKDHAKALIDEIPDSYKSIDEVMAAQSDLVEVVCVLRQIVNFKGQ